MFTSRRILLLVAFLLLLCALLNPRYTRWLTRPMASVVETLQYPAWFVASNVKTDPGSRFSIGSTEPLAEQLEAERTWNDQLWQENKRLRQQLDAFDAIKEIRDIDQIRMVEARVGRFTDDPINPTIKILRGYMQGLKPDDAVVYQSNLLGFVTDEIGPITATVTLISKPGFEVEVNIMPPQGIRSGEGWPVTDRAKSNGKGGFTCDLDDSITRYLQKGDLVRVSDTLRDSANGFVLGTIESIEDHPDRPLQLDRVLILPRTPIGPQRMVTVLTERND